MKRLSIIIFVLCLCSLASYADERDIPIQSVDTDTRSIVGTPEATIENGIISISFDASGVYSLYIEDSMGNIIYTSTLPADGMEYDYDLSGIGTGLLRLVIKGHGGEYEGFFIK
ncbi:MAG TPA: hypothetical protein IAC05_03620 [Candidatus Coprenecus stercorigallinarum]|nr:hypothetical protein [Candidatus Coprenecus stercorigallinarum]